MNIKNILPSKKFTYLIIGVIILVVLVLVITSLFSKKNHFSASKNGQLETGNLTINDLLQKDSDGDGVMDWEEALWGTGVNNPATFNGVSDADYIKQKKTELKITEGSDETTGSGQTETDKFAQEFFASISAMKQSGQISSDTINNVSTALGQKISDPTMLDAFSTKDLKISEQDGVNAQRSYYTNAQKLFKTYNQKGIGEEVAITSTLASLGSNEDSSKYAGQLDEIASAYKEYAQKMIAMPVPQSLASYHLKIANSANNIGIAVTNMVKVVSDPIVGLSGLSQYQKYSDELVTNVGNLEKILYNNGVIIQTE